MGFEDFPKKSNELPPQRIISPQSVDGDRHMAHHNEYEIDVYRLIHATKDLPVGGNRYP